jgi:serine/threonine protein kinase
VTNRAAFCSSCGTELPAGATAGGPCRTCGATPTPPPTYAGVLDPAETLAEQIRRQLLQDLIDATLGEYDIIGELGRGGMASVFLAHEIALDRKVAIKVMAPALMASPGMAERFKREARLSANLSHPNILPIFSVRETEKLVFFVMKCLMGRPLDAVLKETGPLPIATVQVILAQAAAGLAHAHRRGIVHRDIKPGNIMLDDDGAVVVTDFGIAKAAESEGLTVTGSTIGTPAYMSPEQCSGVTLTTAADQYSLGAVAYELLTGRVPFTADTAIGLMYHHVHSPPDQIKTLREDIPDAMAAAIMRMLEKNPVDRWPGLEPAVEAIGHPERTGFNDPVRDELATLASSGSVPKILAASHTPRTPLPAGAMMRRSTARTDPNAATLQVGSGPLPVTTGVTTKIGGISVWAWSALGGILMVGILWATGALRFGGHDAPVTDTVLVQAVTPASSASTTPPSASAPAPAGTTPTRPGTTPARPGAARPGTTPPATTAAPATSTPAPATAAPKPETRAPSATDLGDPTVDTTAAKAAIARVVERFRRATESKRIENVLTVYPALTERQQRDLEELFAKADGLEVEMVIERTRIDVSDRRAEVNVKGFYRYTEKEGGRARLDDVRRRINLAFAPTGWRITQVR